MTQENTANPNHAIALRYKSMQDFLQKKRGSISKLAGEHFDSERMMRLALHAASKNSYLMECSKESWLAFLMECARLDISAIGRGGVWPVPFFNRKTNQKEIQPIIDYRAEIELARRSGAIQSISAHVIYANDDFVYVLGDDEAIHHRPPKLGEDRGEMVGVYAIARLRNGGIHRSVLSMADIQKYRARSKAKDQGPWVTDFEPMALKTALRRVINLLPINPVHRDAIEREEQLEHGDDWVITVAPEADDGDAPEAPEDGGETEIQRQLKASVTEAKGKKAKPNGRAQA